MLAVSDEPEQSFDFPSNKFTIHYFPNHESPLPQSQVMTSPVTTFMVLYFRHLPGSISPVSLEISSFLDGLEIAISRFSRNDSHVRACGIPVPRSASGNKRASDKDLVMNGAEIWWWAMDMDWLGYGKRGRYGQNRRERGM